jgi:hypothetical protein
VASELGSKTWARSVEPTINWKEDGVTVAIGAPPQEAAKKTETLAAGMVPVG